MPEGSVLGTLVFLLTSVIDSSIISIVWTSVEETFLPPPKLL